MDVEVGYLPKNYYDTNPDVEGIFPFAFEGMTPYIFSLEGIYLPDCDKNFLQMWMRNIQAFPLYFCAEIPFYNQDEFEYTCKEFNINYRSIANRDEHTVIVTEIKNEKQFQGISPFFSRIGTEGELVLWSTHKDVFSVEPRAWNGNWGDGGKVVETVVVKVANETSVFHIGHDGNFIAVISNQQNFSTYEKVIKTFPDFVVPKLIEFG